MSQEQTKTNLKQNYILCLAGRELNFKLEESLIGSTYKMQCLAWELAPPCIWYLLSYYPGREVGPLRSECF